MKQLTCLLPESKLSLMFSVPLCPIACGIQEVETFLVIHHPVVKAAPQPHSGDVVASAASTHSTSYGYQLQQRMRDHVPVLIASGHPAHPPLRATATQTRYVSVQRLHHTLHHHPVVVATLPHAGLRPASSSFRYKYNPFFRMPSYHARYPGRNAALSLEEDLLTESEAVEPTVRVYKADAEYPPLNLKNRKKLYSLGYIYMLDFLENTYMKKRR